MKDLSIIFVTGCYRSGTTLFKNIFDKHENIAVTPELHFFNMLHHNKKKFSSGFDLKVKKYLLDRITNKLVNFKYNHQGWSGIDLHSKEFEEVVLNSESYKDFFLRFVFFTASKNNVSKIVTKTPVNIFFLPNIINFFPNAKIINMLRDGREVCASAVKKWDKEGNLRDELEAAAYWSTAVEKVDNFKKDYENLIEVRYKDLVLKPDKELKKVCNFLEIDFDKNFLDLVHSISSESSFSDNENKKGLYYSQNFKEYFSKDKQKQIEFLLANDLEKKNYDLYFKKTSIFSKNFKLFLRFKMRVLKNKIYYLSKRKGYFYLYCRFKNIVKSIF